MAFRYHRRPIRLLSCEKLHPCTSSSWEEDLRDLLIAKFTGGAAKQHKLPAYEAVQSLYGISRSLLIIANYLSEGRVRRRDFKPQAFELNIVAHQEGSFETVFELLTSPEAMTICSGIGLGVAGNFVTDFIKSMWRRSVGEEADQSIENMEREEALNAGDLEALVDAIEPAMREAHKSINFGASNILIIRGDNNIVTLNSKTKDYVNSSYIEDIVRIKLFSVASFNANSGYGRAFDFEEGRTIPFQLMPDADRPTIETILSSMASYTRRKRLGDNLASAVAFQYNAVISSDGRVKRLKVIRATMHLS